MSRHSARHEHPCLHAPQGCTNTVECYGEPVSNPDGWPETLCSDFHRPDGTTDALPCETCEAAACLVCGEVLRFGNEHDESCSQHPDSYDGEDVPDDWWAGPIARNH